ncbi:MAG: DUF4359 domain-containing protein [Hydrococcus sp. SU_1_0]|nr:DUF4359 domain-containing protein [Hydrococcus sp. SU_1_0]
MKAPNTKTFFFFSLYNTRLAISPLTPTYTFGTLGILDQFFTYQAETNN